jgi:BirA family biotin operon repressor/biotin-[acetyl-CoA-carboxylase] ligase
MYKIPDKTVLIGKKIISLPECESTNSLMVSMSQRGGLEEGTVIIAENQTRGRGQAGNQWTTEPGVNLTFSVLLKPLFLEPAQQFYLNMAIGLAICHAISDSISDKVWLKWPNDVMVAGKKVCGILIENQIQGQVLSQSVAGIGVNVNQTVFEWPQATSMKLLNGAELDKAKIFETILIRMEAYYNLLLKKKFDALKTEYSSVLYWKEEEHGFESNGDSFNGKILGIDEVGRLLVDIGTEVRSFNFKEIKFIK